MLDVCNVKTELYIPCNTQLFFGSLLIHASRNCISRTVLELEQTDQQALFFFPLANVTDYSMKQQ